MLRRLRQARQPIWPRRPCVELMLTARHDGRIRVLRRRWERFADNCLIERDRFGGGSDMVWGGIMGRKTNLIVVQGNLNAQGYISEILQPEVVPFLQRHVPAVLMHDNARPHVARICRKGYGEIANFRVVLQLSFSHLVNSRDKNIS